MSEINKPENDNADLKCPFNPNQYNIGDKNITVPAGTSAWALSLVYLGKQVHRSGWNAPIEHMRLAHKSESGSEGDGAAYIEKSDKDGYWSRWTPTQEDLLVCDWKWLESECTDGSMLVFELTSGKMDSKVDPTWGYSSGEYIDAIGSLNIVLNKTDIAKISIFYWIEYEGASVPLLFWNIRSYPDKESAQKVAELFEKTLSITVDNVPYNLGKSEDASSFEGGGNSYGYVASYKSADAQKLSTILKQTGQTKRFCCNWI
ncbi:Thoeris anti-defense Tad2 family protein [Xenorhabdus bovienii]|uniref:Thoeris anti-defense Tad2 family protein n=1 Tax=Xenorhabdus bovienii TaxID=40576 RepID=UPI003DA28144